MIMTEMHAILFACAKPIKLSLLQKNLGCSQEQLRSAIEDLTASLNTEISGVHLLEHDGALQLVSNPAASEAVEKFLRVEETAPLTRPSLETLTIIAYRGPITKPEIEMIRGVNCSLILRNLLIRGFVNEDQDTQKLQPVYSVSHEFMRALGLTHISQLPAYQEFATDDKITELLSRQSQDGSV